MGDILIDVEGVSKKFCRSLKRSLWYGMQDLGNELLGRRHGGNGELRPDEFWAVKDVSFQLKRGECLGLIGHNGAGKTTLLRMLNGLIKPDRGRVEIRGRVGALIALGAGFNPILTGRENVYVNASLLGLRKEEIDNKVEQIIEFSELAEFIDTPVQSYSSGMAVRLGFAVATSIEPDVLLLDEVLAVGDAKFRAKCYNRISQLLEKAAVILVSHNTDHIVQVCSSAVVMNSGESICNGNIAKCINFYNELNVHYDSRSEMCEFTSSEVKIETKYITKIVSYGDKLCLELTLKMSRRVELADVKVTIFSVDGLAVAESYTKYENKKISVDEGVVTFVVEIGPLFIRAGFHRVSVVILDRNNNEHLYWGSKAFEFRMTGPVSGSVNNIPPIEISVCNILT